MTDAIGLVSELYAKGPISGINYFRKFGVTEGMIRETLGHALSHGGDYADIFFQHRVSNTMALEDGEVNQAYSYVGLGAGVRVVRGDQTGYGYTEDLTADSLTRTALTAAAIADGPSRPAPARFRVTTEKANRYPVKTRWEDVRPQQKLAILNALNEKSFKADERVRKVSIDFSDEYGAILIADSKGHLT